MRAEENVGPARIKFDDASGRSNRYRSDFINGRVTRNGDDVNASLPGMQASEQP